MERRHKMNRDKRSRKDDRHDRNQFHDKRIARQIFQIQIDAVGRNAHHNHTDRPLVLRLQVHMHQRNRHFNVTVLGIIFADFLPLDTLDHFLGNNRLSGVKIVGILYDMELLIDNHDTPVIDR